MDPNKFKITYPFIEPPGFYRDFLNGPIPDKSVVVVDIFDEHRYAFYSWATYSELHKPLAIVSFDYHKDLAQISDGEKNDIDNLDLKDKKEISYFCWNHINPLNDSHVCSAMYLNLISDFYLLTKDSRNHMADVKDKYGNTHKIHVFYEETNFIAAIEGLNCPIGIDIDLDYFIERQDGDGNVYVDINKSKFDILSSGSKLFRVLKNNIKAITIAKEPEHCGGQIRSNKIFEFVNERLFNGNIISRGRKDRASLKTDCVAE